MDVVEPSLALRISAIQLNVTSMERAVTFYEAGLGFAIEKRGETATTLLLGGERLDLVQVPSSAAPYPPEPAANDPWFQHFAIRVSDMTTAYARLAQQQQKPISIGGPQQLPPSTGSAIAYKFRDPDGHPLELSFVPGGPQVSAASSPFLTIDHTALAVADIETSVGFWVGMLGLRETGRLLNQGPTQWRLDGLRGALVDIVVLQVAEGGPHIELLHYRNPISGQEPRRAGLEDIAATRLRIRATPALTDEVLLRVEKQAEVGCGLVFADPDGHLVELSS